MDLDERKIKILKAIIKMYTETGEPVGSRTISKLPDLNFSSATIRNEMSDLEELGYILQPHTSAGRIPSDKGYRFYVNEILEEQAQLTEFKSDMLAKVNKLEVVLKQLAKIIAVNTNYAAMISGPNYNRTRIKFLQLSLMEDKKLLIVTVLDGNIIKNTIIDLEEDLSDADLLNINLSLNTHLTGLRIEDINIGVIRKLKESAAGDKYLMDRILAAIAGILEDEDLQIYTSGTTNIFKYPELSDGEKAGKLIDAFEEKSKLREIFTDISESENKNGLQVYIGEEMPIQHMKDYSVVTANYEFGHGVRGTIGIVGPKRMDYEKVFKTINTVMKRLEEELE